MPKRKIKLKRIALKALACGLAWCCDALHWIPGYRCQLAQWSWRLDQKHDLGVWRNDGPFEQDKKV